MPGRLELVADPNAVDRAFSVWHDTVTKHVTRQGRCWWLPDERVMVGNRNDGGRKLMRFVVLSTDPTSRDVTVQSNVPGQYGNENPLSGIGRDAVGRLHPIRQGVPHRNAQSVRIDAQFIERTSLSAVPLRIGAVAAKHSWFCVTLLGVPSRDIGRNIAAFVERCDVARNADTAREAHRDQDRLLDMFGGPENGGETFGQPWMDYGRRRRIQGDVWLALQKLLRAVGRDLGRPRRALGYEVDGEIAIDARHLLLEIRTGTSGSEVYGGGGQLLLYPKHLLRLTPHRHIRLLPGHPTPPVLQALDECGIELQSYGLELTDEAVRVRALHGIPAVVPPVSRRGRSIAHRDRSRRRASGRSIGRCCTGPHVPARRSPPTGAWVRLLVLRGGSPYSRLRPRWPELLRTAGGLPGWADGDLGSVWSVNERSESMRSNDNI